MCRGWLGAPPLCHKQGGQAINETAICEVLDTFRKSGVQGSAGTSTPSATSKEVKISMKQQFVMCWTLLEKVVCMGWLGAPPLCHKQGVQALNETKAQGLH